MTAGNESLARRAVLLWWGPVGLLALLALVLTWVFLVGPPPPKQFRFAAGMPGGAYVEFAESYRQRLAQVGIDMEVVESRGSIDNLHLLKDKGSGVVAALVQGGVVPSKAVVAGLRALGSVGREPLWLFYRGDQPLTQVRELAGKRIAVGAEGSGVRPVAMQVLVANGLDPEVSPTELLSIGGEDALQQLRDGQLDAAFFVSSLESPRVRRLLMDDGIRLMSFERVPAYLSTYEWMSGVTLPQGVVSLSRNVPSQEKHLVAPSTMLVVREDIHPDLIPLLLEAAKRIHGNGDGLTPPGQFPSADFVDLPLDKDAERYMERGPNWLYRTFPYRVAVQLDRLKILLLPLLTLLIPLFKVAPPLYRWRIRAKVFRWYDSLWTLDMRLSSALSRSELESSERQMRELERDLERVRVPASYMSEYYNLRLHAKLVRERLNAVSKVAGS